MTETTESREINRFLRGLGSVPLRSDPLFRIVWSEDMFELRRGTFNEFYGEIFIRQVNAVRRVKKYSYLKDRWVLEQWYPPSLACSEELPESTQGSYEPVYVFQDGNANSLSLNKRVVEIIVGSRLLPASSRAAIKSRINLELDGIDAKEEKYFDSCLTDSVMDLQLHFGEAVQVPSNFDVSPPNLRRKEDA